MDQPSATKRLVGAFIGLILGGALGGLVGMGSQSILFAAALAIGFCYVTPNVTTYIFGEFLSAFE